MRTTAATLTACLLACTVAAAQPAIDWQPWQGTAQDGSPIAGQLGRFRVPENRTRPDGRTIELAFVRFRTSNPNPGPPIFFLAGGPGGSGVELAAITATHPQIRLLEHADVIGLDQRGTGRSVPSLMQTPGAALALPLDKPVSRETYLAAARAAAERCAAYWRDRGVDLAAFNTSESAADLDDLRRALGLDQIVLYGASYGTHLGLAYLRDYPRHVARGVLIGIEGPDDTWKLPSTTQAHLQALHDRLAATPEWNQRIPDLLALVRELLETLESGTIAVTLPPEDGRDGRIVLGPEDLRRELARMLGDSRDIARIPAALLRFASGDWESLAVATLAVRRGELTALTLLMDCASGGTSARRARIERERRDSANLLGDALLTPYYPDLCAACPQADVGDANRRPFACDVPLLLVSGTLDVRTPPENIAPLRPHLSRAVEVLIENAAHDSRELMSPDYRALLQSFLRGESVAPCTIQLPAPFLERNERE